MAVVHGEVVLRQRFCLGQGCQAVFFICTHCDRGHRYCSTECRKQARRQQRRCANRRHQQSPEGRLDHRDRQRAYRCRLRQAQPRVTDQGSLSIISPASFDCGMADAVEASSGAAVLARKPAGIVAALPDLRPHRTLHRSISTHSTTKVSHLMISPETRAQIRRYFYAEHWKVGTIASELGVHPDAVRNAIESERFQNAKPLRASIVDPYIEFVRHTLDQHPRLRATRIYQMIRDRGYSGSVVQLRRTVARLRPQIREPFLRLQTFPGEQAQVDWAHFGHVMVGRAKRALSCFVMTLSYSRALYLEFFFDQTMENFLRGHVHAFQALVRTAAGHSLRQPQKRRAGTPRQSDSVSTPADRVERALSLRATALPGARRQSERPRGTSHPLCARFVLGGPHLHHAGRMQSPGLALARSSGAPTALAWRRRPHGRRCLRRRTAPLAASSAAPLLHRPDRDRALAQDHLCAFRSQRLLHPAGSGRTAADPGGLRYHAYAFSMAPSRSPGITHL